MPNPAQMAKAGGQPATVPASPNIAPEMQQALDIAHAAAKQSSTTPQQTADPAAKIQPALGLNPSDVAPGTGGANLETTPMPSTNPAGQVLGLGETDVAPGNPPSAPAPDTVAPVPVPQPNVVQPSERNLAGPIPTGPEVVGSQKAVDPIKDASSKPDFWKNVMDVAGKTGKSIIELLGDFAAGYSHQVSSPTEQRLAREQELRLQGNELQARKDMLGAQQGFDKQQQQLQIDHDTAMKGAQNDLERQQIDQTYQLRKLEIENQRQMFMLNYRFSFAAQQGNSGAANSFYKFGEQ